MTIASNPNMSTNDTTIFPLAKREMSLAELARRIDLNVQSGWGLQGATSAQLNGLALYCQRHILLPGDDCTLYEGQPWITVDGRVKLMRRNVEYRGYAQRPLSKAEKEEWGWNPDDIVIETTVRTLSYGEIKAFGRVSREEADGTFVKGVRHNAVAKNHPVEMAQKRSLARAERLAFGTDSFVDDEQVEEASRIVIEEQKQPEVVAERAAAYDRIHGSDDDWDNHADGTLVRAADAPLWQEYAALAKEAISLEIDFDILSLPVAEPALREALAGLRAAISAIPVEG